MASTPTLEGTVPFPIASASKPCHTYYKIFGELTEPRHVPLILLHGGPGAGHDCLLPFQHLWASYKIPVIFYDQIGCGESTLLPEKLGDEGFWSFGLFIAELNNLIQHFGLKEYDVLGHSWGGRLAAEFAAQQPPGLRRLILASAVADGPSFVKTVARLKNQLPDASRQAIDEAIRTKDFTTPEYKAALMKFHSIHGCRADPFPPAELAASMQKQMKDRTVAKTLQGPSPFMYAGPLAVHSLVQRNVLPKINVPTLVWNGEFDTSSEECTKPLAELIPHVRRVKLPGASHMPFLDSVEQGDKTLELVGGFLA